MSELTTRTTTREAHQDFSLDIDYESVGEGGDKKSNKHSSCCRRRRQSVVGLGLERPLFGACVSKTTTTTGASDDALDG